MQNYKFSKNRFTCVHCLYYGHKNFQLPEIFLTACYRNEIFFRVLIWNWVFSLKKAGADLKLSRGGGGISKKLSRYTKMIFRALLKPYNFSVGRNKMDFLKSDPWRISVSPPLLPKSATEFFWPSELYTREILWKSILSFTSCATVEKLYEKRIIVAEQFVTTRVDQKCLSYNSHKWEISFHTISYNSIRTENCMKTLWQAFSHKWKLYDRYFLRKPKSCFLFVNLFSDKFSVVFATEHKWQRPWLLKAPKVGRSCTFNA